ncbi:MAG TPA: hypothetical protein VJX92_00455 [Methylomirabilota bacterium]|nr:hypothetical protein [Methylomirabilota bacterium]
MRRRGMLPAWRATILGLTLLGSLTGCADLYVSDDQFPPAQPPANSTRFKATTPGQFPIDVYLSAWGQGYVIYAPGNPPIYLIDDKKGGYVLQQSGAETRFVVRRDDGSGWTVLSASGASTFLLKDKDGPGWTLQAPGEIPTLIQPQ